MSESEEISKLKAEITRLRKHLVIHHQLTDNPLLKGYAPYKGLEKPTADDFDAVLDDLRRKGASIDGDNAYKRDLLDCVVGALAQGAQNRNPPPAGHWGQRFWDIGREERGMHEEMVATLRESRQVITMALKTGAPDWFDTDEKVALHVTVQRIDAAIAKATQ